MPDDLPNLDSDDEEASSRAQEKQVRRDRALAGVAKRRVAKLPLGNIVNLHDAQVKGAATVSRNAQLNLDRFDELEAEAVRDGARTGPQIAAWLNSRGHKPPIGKLWTTGSVYQTRRKSKFRKAALAPPPSPPPKPAIFDADRRFTPEGKERLKKAMEARGMEWGKYADLLQEMGFKRLDPSIAMADFNGRRLRPQLSEALEDWTRTVEAEHYL